MHLHQAYRHADKGDKAFELEESEKATKEYDAARRLAPRNKELIFWQAIALANTGHMEEAEPMFREAFREKGWAKLVPRLSEVGMLPSGRRTHSEASQQGEQLQDPLMVISRVSATSPLSTWERTR